MKKKPNRRRIDVNVEELDRIIDDARSAPLSESDGEKLKSALHALAERLLPQPKTEKISSVFGAEEPAASGEDREPSDSPAGHGRNGADAYRGAEKVEIAHAKLAHGDRCPDCIKGKVYAQKEPRALVRITGQAPLAATVYELERLRCNACGQVFTAEEPEDVGPEKYDETAAAMIAQLKYGSGVPFHRLERMEELLGIPLPAATQWELVEETAEVIQPAHEELMRQAAQERCCTTTIPACGCCIWSASPAMSAQACSPAESFPRHQDARSRCTSPGASTRGRTWPTS